jgi:ribosomal protein L22
MAEEIKQNNKAKEAVSEKKEVKQDIKQDAQVNAEDNKKTEEKKVEQKKISKKNEAVAKSMLGASLKQCMAIGDYIKGKKIDDSIKELNEVINFKRAIPMIGEIPHRKGDIMAGRYPIKASGMIINMLKALKGNVIANQMDLDKTRIVIASGSWASRPQRSGGVKAKRCNMILIAKEMEGKV